MRTIFFVLTLFILALPVRAADAPVIHVGVEGMVCDVCAQSLIKIFKKEASVEKIDVSLEKSLVTITLKPGGTLDDKAISKHIDHAGYKLVNIHRMTGDNTHHD